MSRKRTENDQALEDLRIEDISSISPSPNTKQTFGSKRPERNLKKQAEKKITLDVDDSIYNQEDSDVVQK